MSIVAKDDPWTLGFRDKVKESKKLMTSDRMALSSERTSSTKKKKNNQTRGEETERCIFDIKLTAEQLEGFEIVGCSHFSITLACRLLVLTKL